MEERRGQKVEERGIMGRDGDGILVRLDFSRRPGPSAPLHDAPICPSLARSLEVGDTESADRKRRERGRNKKRNCLLSGRLKIGIASLVLPLEFLFLSPILLRSLKIVGKMYVENR